MSHVAVVDIGKTNAKLALVNTTDYVESEFFSVPNEVLNKPPYPHFDVDALLQFLLKSLAHAALHYDIVAITFTTHGACAALLDKGGQLATPILDYEHTGPDQLASGYQCIRPSFASTGSPSLSGGLNIGAQLHWLFQQDAHLLERVETILMYPQYWAYRFSGVMANEPTSLGCHTDLWNPMLGDYSSLTDTLGIRHKMAPVKSASTQLGHVTARVASITGIKPTTPVYCGIHDSNASLYAHLNNIEGQFSVISTGTWVICMSPGGSTTSLDESRDTLINVNALGVPTPSSRFMGGREYDYLNKTYQATETDIISQRVLDSKAMILPAVETSSGPFRLCDYVWTVDPTDLTPNDRYCAISFYLAMMTHVCLELTPTGGPIIVEGPFAANRLFCTMLSVAANRTVIGNAGNATGTSIGAALLTLAKPKAENDQYRNLADDPAGSRLLDYSNTWTAQALRHSQKQ